ncbi:MAG: hypothetical protein U0838_02380 [Chloroflexota bacterium]
MTVVESYVAAFRDPIVAAFAYVLVGLLGSRSSSSIVRLAAVGVVGCLWMLAVGLVQPRVGHGLVQALLLTANVFAAAVVTFGAPAIAVDRALRAWVAARQRSPVSYLLPVAVSFASFVWAAYAAWLVSSSADATAVAIELALTTSVAAACSGLVHADRRSRPASPRETPPPAELGPHG